MLAASLFTALLASASLRLARSDVTPNEPGPGGSFNQGTQCHIAWAGDTNSTTMWKDMAIELMSGSNSGMVHLTTVATGQDGTTSGTFDYPCPEVKPNSAIYFYQFTSPQSTAPQWTTRFTLAGPGGETTEPENPTQPDDEPIPWGTGALADPSKATPPPTFAGAGAGAGASSAPGSGAPSGVVNTLATTPSSAPPSSTRLVTTPASSKPATSSGRPTSSAQGSASTGNSNAAVNSLIVDMHVFHAAVILIGSTVAFTAFL
jgi:hypothetical protein